MGVRGGGRKVCGVPLSREERKKNELAENLKINNCQGKVIIHLCCGIKIKCIATAWLNSIFGKQAQVQGS